MRARPAASAAVAGLTMSCLLATPAQAQVDGPVVDGGGDNGGIDTGIHVGGTPGTSAAGSTGNAGGPLGGSQAPAKCDYIAFANLDDPGPPLRRAYRYECDDGTTAGYVLVADGQAPDTVPTVTPGELAQRAYNTLRLPKPLVGMSPPYAEPGRFQIVNYPIWWWVENFAPLTQRTELGDVWAEVTATPVFSFFDGGEGAGGAQCNGPGVAWRHNLPSDYRLACTYSYRRAADRVTAAITVTWNVTWIGSGGTGGELDPMQVVTPIPLTVYERQAVNVPVDS